MGKKELSAIGRKRLEQLNDPKVRASIAFMPPGEIRNFAFLLSGGMIIMAGLFLLWAVLDAGYAEGEAMEIYEGRFYYMCHDQESRIVYSHEACRILREGEETGEITNASEFAAAWGEYAYWSRINGGCLPILASSAIVLAAGISLGYLGGKNPFMFTAVGEKVIAGYSGERLESLEISGKKVELGMLKKRAHFLVREIGGYMVVSFVDYTKFEVSASRHRAVMDGKQWEAFGQFLKKFKNVGESELFRHHGGKVMEFGEGAILRASAPAPL